MIPEGADLVFLVGLILMVAFIGGRLANRVRLPEVTGYILVGIFLKLLVDLLGLIEHERLELLLGEHLGQIPQMTLALIAFIIGGSLPIDQLKRLGRGIAWIGMMEGFGAFVCVTSVTFVVAPYVWAVPPIEGISPIKLVFAFALLLGALSSATAPAATVAVIRELRARGDVTTTLLGVVGFDDAVALFIFTFATAIASGLLAVGAQAGSDLYEIVALPLIDIFGAAVLGIGMGFVANWGSRFAKTKRETTVGALGFVLLSGGIAIGLGVSPLFTNMFAGFTLINLSPRNIRIFRALSDIDAPIYAMFFTLAGTHLEFSNLGMLGALGAVYIVARFGGKLLGVRIGARLGHAPSTVGRYLGFGLLPQAGVAIGLVLVAQTNPSFASFAPMLTNIILGTVAVNELVGPPLTVYALRKAGEVVGAKPRSDSKSS
ncbi:MAG: hypothetical protein DRH70_01695 [Candidatus Coatesbacteria bacterium]|nr:MAG: hypothetical protein DRH70_01695 [Candidatus Coatesbacteria bacterium]